MYQFDLLHTDMGQRKVVCESTGFGWVYLGMPSHTQTCLYLPGVALSRVWGFFFLFFFLLNGIPR